MTWSNEAMGRLLRPTFGMRKRISQYENGQLYNPIILWYILFVSPYGISYSCHH